MKLSPPEQLVVLDAVLTALSKLRDHAAINNDGGAAQRLDKEHSGVDNSKQKLLWSIDANEQKAYSALTKVLNSKPAKKAAKRPQSASKRTAGKRVRSK